MADYYLTKEGKLRKKKADYRLVNGKLVANTENATSLTEQKPSGAFADGYRFGDLSKTWNATSQDLKLSFLEGIAGLGEGVTDLALYGVSGAAKLLGAKDFATKVKNVAAENSVNGFFNKIRETSVGDNSVAGETANSVASGLGQVAGIILTGGAGKAAGLGAKAVSALTTGTMAAASTGSGLGEAYQGGATDKEALAYGLMKGAVDAGSELLFGGLGKTVGALGLSKGISSLDDMFAKRLSSKISSHFCKTLVQAGVKASAEGAEEVLAGIGTAVAKDLTYMSEKDLRELIEDENLLEQFVVGAVTSGIAQGGDVVTAVKQKTDLVSGLTKNEQAVVDKVYRDLVAQEEKSGKVTQSRKSKIYDQVLSDMDKGRIPTDAIEEILGKDALSQYDSLSKEAEEFKTLYETEGGKLSEKQKDRLAELKMKNQANAYEGLLKSERAKISRNVADMVKADRLSESYNEQGRKSQKFEADVSQYDAKQRQTIQNAIDSGILNNTNRTHEFVDLIARISADKGVAFDFADNAKLKETGFALDGVTVNGFVNENGVTVNINSAKALNSVVGHEITHVLEGTELYDTLAQAITEYAKSKGEYDSRLAQLTKLYEGRNANIEQEVVADLVGDYLFTDTDFVNRLSTEHRNVFEKIFDEIKYLCKVATAGSKEARQLEKVKKTFEEAYRTETKNPTTEGGVRYALGQYTDTQKENWKNSKKIVVYENDAQLLQFVADSIADKDAANKMYLGIITGDLAKRIKADAGLDCDGKNAVLRAKNVRKILLHDHGNAAAEKLRGQIAVTNTDFLAIKDIFGDPDTIKPEPNGYNGKPAATFEKVIGPKKYTMFVVDSGGSLDVFVQTMYIHNNKKGSIANVANAKALTSTPKATVGTAPNNNVQQNKPAVKSTNSLSNQQADDLFPLPGSTYGKDIALEFPLPPGYTEQAHAATAQSKDTTLEFPLPPGYKEQVGADAEQENAFPLPPGVEEAAKTADVLVHEDDRKRTFGDKLRGALEDTKKTANTIMTNFADKGWVFENLAKKTNNRELEAKYNFLHYSESRAQQYIKENLMPLRDAVKKTGKTKEVYEYVYHLHNIDRMNLEQPKPVFGDGVTADVSREKVRQLETENPEFAELGKAIVGYNTQIRNMLVDGGVISQETADKWAKMYPHYVPIRRAGKEGLAVNVPLDTGKTGINAPVKGAKGGNSDIEDLIDSMALRTEQTFKAIAKNNFGLELMRTLGTPSAQEKTTMDTILDNFDSHEDLLQEGKNGKSPTFTVFENGEKITFEITKEMYDAMKPTSENLAKTYKIPNAISNFHRGLLTDKNPAFLITNAIKDAQDVLINSQHAAKTYGNFPEAIKELASCGEWYREYIANGGEQNTYFESDTKTFNEEPKGIQRWVGKISEANNFVERVPRLAEYIASRKQGKSIEVAMLDAARVTTNFSAGGDMTKFLNRNGATFLNASVQGAMQQVRNIREANSQGLKGWAVLAAKAAGIGLSGLLVNHLLWDDDEDYEDLSDYVKQNYYVIAKTGDGQFVRIPKGRTLAVIQEAFMQMENLITGNDEVDIGTFADLVITNLAPNNPIDNNILAPIMQVANNTTWYGEDLVPTRLQDVPDAEQYDESIDVFSKWLGEKTDYSPYKINYLLDQYSGALGDVILPYLTPEAEGSLAGATKVLAPFVDKFTTDSVMNNQNVSDFYDMLDQLLVNANSMKATDEDTLMSKYMNAMNSDLSDLYKLKREIQNSDLPEAEKFARVRELKKQINALAEGSLAKYGDVDISGDYATVGDLQFRWYEPGEDSNAEPGWKKLTEDQIAKQDAVTSGLGISPSEYWGSKAEYDYAYENPGKYALSQAVGGYDSYKVYRKELGDITSDKDKNGKAIADSRKAKVVDYINNLDAEYGEKIILYVSEFNSKESRDMYGYEIVDYLNSRSDISYSQMEAILIELGFKVGNDGRVTW